MLFNVRPRLRQWHNVWLSKPSELDIAGQDISAASFCNFKLFWRSDDWWVCFTPLF